MIPAVDAGREIRERQRQLLQEQRFLLEKIVSWGSCLFFYLPLPRCCRNKLERTRIWTGDHLPTGEDLLTKISRTAERQGIPVRPETADLAPIGFQHILVFERIQNACIQDFVNIIFLSPIFRRLSLRDPSGVKLFLYNKLVVLIRKRENVRVLPKGMAIDQAVYYCQQRVQEAITRILTDSRAGLLTAFAIQRRDTIQKLIPLGKETHLEGRLSWGVEFFGRGRVVYKPRSVMPEYLLYQDRRRPRAAISALGSYTVVCRGDYGYMQWLQGTQAGNTLATREQLKIYIKQLYRIQFISRRLTISDLHFENIFISNRRPYIIDAEVYGLPRLTGIEEEEGPLRRAFRDDDPPQHRVYFSPELREALLEPASVQDLIARLHIDVDRIKASVRGQLQKPLARWIRMAREELFRTPGRLVLIRTVSLLGYLQIPDGEENLCSAITSEVHGSIIPRVISHQVSQLLRTANRADILRDDIPIFFWQPNTSRILYGTPNGLLELAEGAQLI